MLTDNMYKIKRLRRSGGVLTLPMLNLIFSPEDTIDDIALYVMGISSRGSEYSYNSSIQCRGKINNTISKSHTLQNKCKQDILMGRGK